jgi:hypothetical protein
MPRTDVMHVLMRRWYFVVAGLLITVGLGATATVVVPVTYSAQASVLLLPPKGNAADNPLLALSDLQSTAATIARGVFDDAATASLAKQGITSGYSVAVDLTTSAPLLIAKATGSTPAKALAAMRAVAALVPVTLIQLQKGLNVTPASFITTRVIHQDQQATKVTRTRTRVLFVAIAAGLALTWALVVGGDRLLLSGRLRKSEPRKPREPRRLPRRKPRSSGPTVDQAEQALAHRSADAKRRARRLRQPSRPERPPRSRREDPPSPPSPPERPTNRTSRADAPTLHLPAVTAEGPANALPEQPSNGRSAPAAQPSNGRSALPSRRLRG